MRRPGIRDVVEADLRLLARLAEIVEARLPDLRRYRPAEVVQQFTVSLRRELDSLPNAAMPSASRATSAAVTTY